MRPLQPMLISLVCSSQISPLQISPGLSESVRKDGGISGRKEEEEEKKKRRGRRKGRKKDPLEGCTGKKVKMRTNQGRKGKKKTKDKAGSTEQTDEWVSI